ncbi:radical SAM protein [Ruminiclostridium cellobioparum]|jgi:organic radical activating enzyme|uniref:radical SAM protein n=1 Tax=Ruminiclostridium cellobioparum TaxID=29355 RepID=UPI0004810880|nr:radical SAM protein [Ruminiclostridium cellobioparum]
MIYNYPHPEYFSDWEKPDFPGYKGNLVLWGAGKVGGVAAHCLKKQGIEFMAFCDIARDKWGTTFCDHKIISPEELKRNHQDAVIIITSSFHNSIEEELRKYGFTKVFDCTSLFMMIDFSSYNFWMEIDYAVRVIEQYLAAVLEQKANNQVIDQIFLNITTKCSLRCKHCSTIIPYISSPCHYNSQKILGDVTRILDALGHIRVVDFYGGEPLLHPDLPYMIKSLSEEKRIDRIYAITNGTIIPNDDLIEAMKAEKRFSMRISHYGALSTKVDTIKNILDKNCIKYEVTNYTYWDEGPKFGYLDSTEEELVSKFKHCTACNVLMIQNGKISLCSPGSVMNNMNVVSDTPSDYVDLSDNESAEELRDRILNFRARSKTGEYFKFCKYCFGNHCSQFENKVPVAEQTKELLLIDKFY